MITRVKKRNLYRVIKINKELCKEGFTWLEIQKLWERYIKVAQTMPNESVVVQKRQRKTISETKRVLGKAVKQPLNID